MRLVSLVLIPICLLSACVPRRPRLAHAEAAPGPSLESNELSPIHRVSEVEPPPVLTVSEPVPGFMRGINLGNALDAPSEGAWGVTLERNHFALAKAAGLDHVRLPVRFSAHAKQEAPYTIESSLFERIDWAIEQAAALRLSIIIDLHHYEELMKKPKENGDRLVGMWKQIAERYKDKPATVAFELINEPCNELDSEFLNPITQRALAVVRASNPRRTVFVDSYFWAAADRLNELELPDDANVVPSFHDYQPILFTHQGMPWMPAEFQTRGIVFPGPPAVRVMPVESAQKTDWVSQWFASYNDDPVTRNSSGPKAIFDYFKLVEDYVKSTKRRVYMGEFGVSKQVDPRSRESWLRIVRQEAEKRHIGWALWDDGGQFRAMNVKESTWEAPIQAGLFH